MKNWFAPAMYLIGRMRYPVKFAVILVLVLVPLLFLSYQMVSTAGDQIDFLENERIGLEYVKDVRQPVEHIQQHRGMTAAYLGGAVEFKARIMEKRKDVDRYLEQLAQTDARLGSQLDTAGKIDALRQQWEQIKRNSLHQSMAKAIGSHTALVNELLKLKAHVADASGITLDPELDSYYLGDALVNSMPKLMENMGQARAVGSGVAAKGGFTQATYVRLAVLVSNIESYSEQLGGGLQAAIKANDRIRDSLGQAIEENNKAIQEIKNLLQKDLLDKDKITISSKKVFDTATRAISGSYQLYDAMVPELDDIWQQRIDELYALEYLQIAVVAVVLLLLCYLFAGFYFSIKETVSQVGAAAGAMAAGDLSTRLVINTNDEMQQIATHFNQMGEQFEAAIQKISSATSQLAAASEEVATVAQESAGNLANQRAETEQVATAMNQMASTVQEVAKSASDAAEAAANADQESNNGSTIVQQAAESIERLAGEVERSAEVVNRLAVDSDEIGAVLDVIKGIAEQTNLLALNAAIEAARAGEQGRGFAVVADEVRTLAGRTQESTEEIETMIEKLQTGAKNAVTAMQAGQEQAKVGVEHTSKAGDALNAITQAVAVINQMNSQIASAAEEQSITADEMNQNIVNINNLSEQTAESAQQSTASSEELSTLAVELQGLVSQFKVS